MKFVGSTTIYAYLQAIGVYDAHLKDCDCYNGNLQNSLDNNAKELQKPSKINYNLANYQSSSSLTKMLKYIACSNETFIIKFT